MIIDEVQDFLCDKTSLPCIFIFVMSSAFHHSHIFTFLHHHLCVDHRLPYSTFLSISSS